MMNVLVVSQQTGELIGEAYQDGLLAGLIIGLAGIGFIAMLYYGMERASLKRYLLYADEDTKEQVMEGIRSIRDRAESLANRTNTTYFKSLSNRFHSLIAFIKRRNLG
jgi:hypothetical protein